MTLQRPIDAPALYAQDGQGYKAIVSAHYFVGSSDWLITEYDPSQDRAFGWACLNGDRDNAELGYVSMAELDAARVPIALHVGSSSATFEAAVEHDSYWPEGMTLDEAISHLDERQGR